MKKKSKKLTKIMAPVAIATGCLAAAPMASCSKTSIYHYDGKICDYLHEITYEDYRYDSDYETIKEAEAFGCSSVRCGNIYGRNFDYVYNDTPEFIVHVKANEQKQRHGSLAVATHFGLREDKLNAGKYDKQLELIPNLTMDGINDAGVICSSNVVSMESDGRKTINPQTRPGEGKPNLHVLFIPRYVLDNANSAEDAVERLTNDVNIMGNLKNEMYIHTMIADKDNTYIVEFFRDVDSEHDHFDVVAIKYTGDEQIMTNYYVNVREEGHESFDNNEKFGDERYDLLKKHYPADESECTMQNMVDLMKLVKFSLAYEEDKDEEPYQIRHDQDLLETTEWYSEKLTQSFIQTYKPIPDQSRPWQEAIEGLQKMKEAYKNKDRKAADPAFWHTTHNSTYDISKGDLWVIVQEQYNLEPYKFHIDFN